MHRSSSRAMALICAVVLLDAVQPRAVGQVDSPDGLWRRLPPRTGFQPFASDPTRLQPERFELLTLAADLLERTLARARPVLDSESPRVSLPLPDGRYVVFGVQETVAMDPELAAASRIKTYRGVADDDPSVTTRFEIGPEGMQSVIMTREGRFFVDHVRDNDRTLYVAYAAPRPGAERPRNQPAGCTVTPLESARASARYLALDFNDLKAPEPAGSRHRTFRLAVGTTGEYAQYHGGTREKALAAVVATINRVNEVYETDLAISFRLVARQRELIHLEPDKDPYTNDNPGQLLDENEKELEKVLGAANFDIGHVFSTGGGGRAELASACQDLKARGVTGQSDPAGDKFAIDFVAHELGHQLGANHSFNGTDEECSYRNSDTAYEPGSGSTVMGYAGICGPADLQPSSQPYFHAGSLAEIRAFITGGGGEACGTRLASGNTPPKVVADPKTIAVPKRTPFVLKGSATDATSSRLTYTWEEMDLGPEAPPDDDQDGALRPLFRSYGPARDSVRVLPRLDVVLGSAAARGETMAVTPRVMRFRLTVRDNGTPAGSYSYTDVLVTVAGSGPFEVTYPKAADQVQAGVSIPIRWNVNGTDTPPVSCANVRILLSHDGGRTYQTLEPSTPNDGEQPVKFPETSSPRAIVRIEANPGHFFNVSGAFSIVSTDLQPTGR
jgi:Metallo-peptidase family M12B Reprolysin-like